MTHQRDKAADKVADQVGVQPDGRHAAPPSWELAQKAKTARKALREPS